MSPETILKVVQIVMTIGAVAVGAAVLVGFQNVIAESLRQRRWRRRARKRECVHCGHSLEGLESNQCPECGKDGRLSSPTNRATAYWSSMKDFWRH